MAGRGSLAGLLAYGDANADRGGNGRRGAARREANARACGRATAPIRSGQMDVFLDAGEAHRLRGCAEFPDRRHHRRHRSAPILKRPACRTACEVDMIATAHARDMLTTPYVFNEDEAAAMAKAGAETSSCATWGSRPAARSGRGPRSKLVATARHMVDEWSEAGAQGAPRRCRCSCTAGRSPSRPTPTFVHEEYQELPRLLRRVIDGAPAGRGRH